MYAVMLLGLTRIHIICQQFIIYVTSVHVSSVSHITFTNCLHKGENLHSCEVCCYVSILITAVIMKIRKQIMSLAFFQHCNNFSPIKVRQLLEC